MMCINKYAYIQYILYVCIYVYTVYTVPKIAIEVGMQIFAQIFYNLAFQSIVYRP